MSWSYLLDRSCDALALLLPVILVWQHKARGILFGAVAADFFLSMPQVVLLVLDPDREGGAHIHWRGGPDGWVILNLIVGLVYSVLLYVPISVHQLWRTCMDGRSTGKDGSSAPSRVLPTARIIERNNRPDS